jgi:bile acid:Na+ symporter, BASS family
VDGQSPLVEIGLPIALFVIMVGIGLTLTRGDFRREAKQPRGMVLGSVGQLVVMPVLGFAIAALLDLEPALAVGLVIAATIPGGTTSNLVCLLGRANVALSIVLTVVASLITIVTIPFVVDLAIDTFGSGTDADVSLPVVSTVLQLIAIVLVPVVIGMLIRARKPDTAARLERGVSAFGAIVLVALIIGIAAGIGSDIPTLLRQAGPAVLLLNAAGIVVGGALGAVGGLPWRDRLTLAVELGVKNATLGILIATLLSSDATYTVPSAVYGVLMYLTAALLVAVGRRSMAVVEPAVPRS